MKVFSIACEKVLSSDHKVSGDFIIEECEIDGNPASNMKRILVRQ